LIYWRFCRPDRFDLWIRSIDSYGGSDLLYLNPKGNIPAAAVIKQGEKRDRRFRERRLFDATSFPASSGPQRTQVEEADEVDDEEDIPDVRNLTELEG
jgi:tRNA pseudouridine38-40 synthase